MAKGTITPNASQPCNPATNGFTLTESYVLGQSGETLTTLNGTGNWQRTNVYGAGQLLTSYDAAGEHFHLTDPLGSRRVQTNSVGEAELDCQSLPFGDQLSCFADPNAPNDDANADATGAQTGIHFTGKERDAESGLDFFGARYYGSNIGRFMSPDLQDMDEDDTPQAVPNGSTANPQSLNLYSFTENNPLSKRDYDGHASWQACPDGSGICWAGDYNGEQNNGLFWNSQSNEWQGGDPNPPPDSDPAGMFFAGLTRAMLGQSHGYSQMGRALLLDGPTLGMKSIAALIPFVGKPLFVPQGWDQKPDKKGTGVVYTDPSNSGNSVRLSKGDLNSSNPGQQHDYMVVHKNGQRLGADGSQVPRASLESHIPQGTELSPDTFEPIP